MIKLVQPPQRSSSPTLLKVALKILGGGIFFISLLLTGSLSAFAQNKSLTPAQQDFLDAYQAILQNDRNAIAHYKRTLKDYPLYPYVLYHDYRRNFKETPKQQIKRFIANDKNGYLSYQLYKKWLTHLAKTGYWTTYLEEYTPQKNLNLQCYYVQALANRKQLKSALKYAKPIWENSTGLSSACRPLDKLLRNNKQLTGTMVWNRINLAMNKRKTSLAKKLSKHLSKKEQEMFQHWLKVYHKPHLVAKPLPSFLSPPIRKKIFTQGVRYLASKNPSLAKKSLEKYYKQYGLNRDQYLTLNQKIALRTAYRYAPQAKAFLNEVNTNGHQTEETLRWQAQIALKHSNWLDLLDTIELMPPKDQQANQWIYWKARALEATNQDKPAQALYKKLATKRDYYAFLSADRLNLPYQFNPNPVKKVDTATLIQKYPELQRIQELLAIDWPLSTKREWYSLLNKADKNEFYVVGILANQWEQHAQAIRSMAKAKDWNALHLRFPTPYKEPVMQHAEKNNIDPAWIYGIMRRESAFSVDIKSPVGATGLMQIMPKTAKYMSQKLGGGNISYKKLTQAENNIELGSAYLKYLNQKYNGNKVLATAAYNAGPNRVDHWVSESLSLPADQWVDSITFSETRAYVKAVLEYTTLFKSLLNQKYDRLSDVMPDIGGSPIQKTDPKHP
ncbi:Soluble lytic murein transglycosylase precursor [hydrothermal vent metagenome]|uniref:Soluble lytic murein transglycosylase n=1 Tax=hydrothermal vent metagenome TaxID=652676 RepID=A0A3B0VV30_9ZZZZ